MSELSPPATAVDADDGDEVCRLWVAEGDSHVVLNYGMFGDDELRIWGMLLADVAAHVVRAGTLRNPSTIAEAFGRLEAGFRERLAHNPTLTGAFGDRSFQ